MSGVSFNPDIDAPASVDYMIPRERQISMGGNWARRLMESELDVGAMRPYFDNNFRQSYITRNEMGWDPKTGRPSVQARAVPTNNDNNATLRILDWIQLDEAVIKAARPRLRAAADLRAADLVYQLPNGIAKTVMQFQQVSDITGASVSMDGLHENESDRPVFSTINFPLPIIHKDFQFPLRELMASRTGYSPLDTTTAEMAARKVAEQVEQLTLGCPAFAPTSTNRTQQLQGVQSYTWGGASVYGYMNFPNRITYSLSLPTGAGWVPQNTLDDILNMKRISQQSMYFGPWMIYTGLYWDPYMDDDYKATYNDMTLRERIRQIDNILDVKTVDYIPDQSIIMVQMSTNVARLVIGMDITTVQWESHGGWMLNFKVLCVMLPQLRYDFYGNTGLIHGS